jgi:hypothetical protein
VIDHHFLGGRSFFWMPFEFLFMALENRFVVSPGVNLHIPAIEQ